jgi:hypothetical protein
MLLPVVCCRIGRSSLKRASCESRSTAGSVSVGNSAHLAEPSVGNAVRMLRSQSTRMLIWYRAATRPSQLQNASSRNDLGAISLARRTSSRATYSRRDKSMNSSPVRIDNFCRVVGEAIPFVAPHRPKIPRTRSLRSVAGYSLRGCLLVQLLRRKRDLPPRVLGYQPSLSDNGAVDPYRSSAPPRLITALVERGARLLPCRAPFVPAHRVLLHTHRRHATTDTAPRAASRTSCQGATCCPTCAAPPWRT